MSADLLDPIDEKHLDDDSDDDKGGEESTVADFDKLQSSSRDTPLAQKETRWVNYSKILVVVVILVMAAVIGALTYHYVSSQEEADFQKQFENVARDIVASSDLRGRAIFNNVESLSATITTVVAASNQTWPFVVVPDFQVLGMVSNKLTGALNVGICPIVFDKDRSAWGAFSAQTGMTWLAEGHQYDDEADPELYVETRIDSMNKQDENTGKRRELQGTPPPGVTEGDTWTPPPGVTGTPPPFVAEAAGGPPSEGSSGGPPDWVNEGTPPSEGSALSPGTNGVMNLPTWDQTGVLPIIWEFPSLGGGGDDGFSPIPRPQDLYYAPYWQVAPAPDFSLSVNLDLVSQDPNGYRWIDAVVQHGKPLLSTLILENYLQFSYDNRFDSSKLLPHSYIFQPIFDTLTKDREVVGILAAFLDWTSLFKNVLPAGEKPIVVVLDSNCQNSSTYELRGDQVRYLGLGDFHDPSYDHEVQEVPFAEFATLDDETGGGAACTYSSRIYPTKVWSDDYYTSNPYFYAAAVVCCFLVTTLVFIIYDCFVTKRNNTVMESAKKTNQIVSSLFPSNVRDRLMEALQPEDDSKKLQTWPKASEVAKNLLQDGSRSKGNFPDRSNSSRESSLHCITSDRIFGSKPIADLFPETTVMFADMVGFTAWSSVRDPTAVFTLLETVYHAFDLIAKRRRVFKVETIGDCYVAVAGVPVARKDHATCMARFAQNCLEKMDEIVRDLESHFGPDTSDLCMRIGLHSGPVTAGVLRGDKGRFQLFGDTMNTASRMESTGVPRKIQVSKETASLLEAARKSKWITPREEKVFAKGKGEMQTYFLAIKDESRRSGKSEVISAETWNSTSASTNDEEIPALKPAGSNRSSFVAARNSRLIEWNVDILSKLLKQVVARREIRQKFFDSVSKAKKHYVAKVAKGSRPIDEVVDVLSLPHFDEEAIKYQVDPESISLSNAALSQLNEFVARIAALYNANPFHNFEHASHVTLSVTKLLGRIVNPIDVNRTKNTSDTAFASQLHDHTFGITSDPLTHFAAVFSALIHDCNHAGVPNTVLINEDTDVARKYKGKSVAEQNSVDLAFKLLLKTEFKDLQDCIYANEDEFARFRSLVVNLVLATDIMDKELGAQRKSRWTQAFSTESAFTEASSVEDLKAKQELEKNRKATIVLEHLIQASDVAHTMQHWHVFQKWNERLFKEMYSMYLAGRLEKDPSVGWYEGEIGFFDFYIIPLARKLETCGIFGVSSSEYLGYAENNRMEWVTKGTELVEGYLQRFYAEHETEIGQEVAPSRDAVDDTDVKESQVILEDSLSILLSNVMEC